MEGEDGSNGSAESQCVLRVALMGYVVSGLCTTSNAVITLYQLYEVKK